MNKKISISVALAITIIAMTVTFAITFVWSMRAFDNTVAGLQPRVVLNNKLSDLDKYVRGNYYGEIEDSYLGDRTARGYIDGLRDPYAVYYTPAEYTELQNIESGKLPSIGVEVMRDANGYYSIIKVYENSPAQRAGVEVNGIVETVEGVEARTFTSVRQLQSALRGEVGTTVTLECRYNETDLKSFTVQRDSYMTPTVFYTLDGNIAHIRVTAFGSETYANFDFAVREALANGAQGFVFDMRGTPGTAELRATYETQYNQVYQMIDMLCPLGTVAKAEYKNGTTKVLKMSDDENQVDLPMVVVVNAYTAGPGELFATSVRDLAGGQLVGTQTAGRGMLQGAPQRMSDGSAVVVTVAKLLTSDGTSFEGEGLVPDVDAAMDSEDEISFQNINIRTDRQVLRAIETLRTMGAGRNITLEPAPAEGGGTLTSQPTSLPPENAGEPEEGSSTPAGEEDGDSPPDSEPESNTTASSDGA